MEKSKLAALRVQLEAVHQWPSIFMFKFILPSEEDKISQIKSLFDESAEITIKKSSKGKYTSISVKEMIMKSDDVFDRYTRASAIEGVISL